MDSVKKSLCKVTLLVLCLFLSATLKSTAYADTVYTYTGNAFDYFTGGASSPPYTNISGSFIVAVPLAPDTTYNWQIAPPITYSFTDGLNVWTPANSWSLGTNNITTGASGNIVNWFLDIVSSAIPSGQPGWGYPGMVTVNTPQNGQYDSASYSTYSTASMDNNPGMWTGPPCAPTAVPEPSIMLLLGSGLIALAGWGRKFKK